MNKLQKILILEIMIYLIMIFIAVLLGIYDTNLLLSVITKILIVSFLLIFVLVLLQTIKVFHYDFLIRGLLSEDEYKLYKDNLLCDPISVIEKEKVINKIHNYFCNRGD